MTIGKEKKKHKEIKKEKEINLFNILIIVKKKISNRSKLRSNQLATATIRKKSFNLKSWSNKITAASIRVLVKSDYPTSAYSKNYSSQPNSFSSVAK